MSRSRNSLACTLLVLLVMATPGAWAAPLQEARTADSLNLFARLWETVAAIWAPLGYTMGLAMDQQPPPAPTADEGCGIDPHGGCRPGS
jgi:hypothetical protein